ncbi:Transposase [Cordylochernes scorpioides]|uniref:Transposase n=1 Tax=Cordylochernes scorpioides TaxID=51811 RepID=A0ABY6K4N9_9ARAC|nr:Transposase [Cordylochernes scorpioides]
MNNAYTSPEQTVQEFAFQEPAAKRSYLAHLLQQPEEESKKPTYEDCSRTFPTDVIKKEVTSILDSCYEDEEDEEDLEDSQENFFRSAKNGNCCSIPEPFGSFDNTLSSAPGPIHSLIPPHSNHHSYAASSASPHLTPSHWSPYSHMHLQGQPEIRGGFSEATTSSPPSSPQDPMVNHPYMFSSPHLRRDSYNPSSSPSSTISSSSSPYFMQGQNNRLVTSPEAQSRLLPSGTYSDIMYRGQYPYSTPDPTVPRTVSILHTRPHSTADSTHTPHPTPQYRGQYPYSTPDPTVPRTVPILHTRPHSTADSIHTPHPTPQYRGQYPYSTPDPTVPRTVPILHTRPHSTADSIHTPHPTPQYRGQYPYSTPDPTVPRTVPILHTRPHSTANSTHTPHPTPQYRGQYPYSTPDPTVPRTVPILHTRPHSTADSIHTPHPTPQYRGQYPYSTPDPTVPRTVPILHTRPHSTADSTHTPHPTPQYRGQYPYSTPDPTVPRTIPILHTRPHSTADNTHTPHPTPQYRGQYPYSTPDPTVPRTMPILHTRPHSTADSTHTPHPTPQYRGQYSYSTPDPTVPRTVPILHTRPQSTADSTHTSHLTPQYRGQYPYFTPDPTVPILHTRPHSTADSTHTPHPTPQYRGQYPYSTPDPTVPRTVPILHTRPHSTADSIHTPHPTLQYHGDRSGGRNRTISRRLVANGLHSCRPLRRLPLTPPNRRQRLEWCRARSTWMTEWHRVVFSDESRFCLSSDSRRVRVWRRRGERSNPAAIVERPTVRQRGIMVWGAIAYDSRSPLLRIQGTMTAQRYVDDVLRPVTLPYLQGVPNALYQQDNARPHTARISQQALQDVQMLPWPPYSPDLSPIEHVWDIIGRRLHALPQPRSEDELWQMVEREWRAIPQDAIRTLIDSLPRRVAACIAVRGGPTCY